MSEYNFAVGSLKFRDFRDLYSNIKERATEFSKKCHILNGDATVISFDLRYEKTATKNRFIFIWEPQVLMIFQNNAEMSEQLRSYLPKFQKVGSLAAGGSGPQKFYGYLDVSKLE